MLKASLPAPHHVTAFGDWAFKQVVKITRGRCGGPWSSVAAVPKRLGHRHAQEEDGEDVGREATCKPRAAPNPRWARESSLLLGDSHGGGAPCPPCRRGSFSGKQTAAVGLGKEQAACRGRVRDPSVGSPSRLSRVRVGHSGTPETEGGPTLGAPRGSRPAETLTLTMCVCEREGECPHP